MDQEGKREAGRTNRLRVGPLGESEIRKAEWMGMVLGRKSGIREQGWGQKRERTGKRVRRGE